MNERLRIAADVASAPLSQSRTVFVAALAILTVVGIASGAVLGLQAMEALRAAGDGKSGAALPKGGRYSDTSRVEPLGPIITNLAGPSSRGVRFEGSLVIDAQVPTSEAKLLAAKVSEDVLAYLRTIALPSLEGASGFQFLREDLNDRVRIRSNGRANELIIQSLIVE